METFQIIFGFFVCYFASSAYGAVISDRIYVKTLSVNNGGQWGSWQSKDFCPRGSYAIGFEMKVNFLTTVSSVGSSPTRSTCETSQVLLAGMPGGFSLPPPTDLPVSYELK